MTSTMEYVRAGRRPFTALFIIACALGLLSPDRLIVVGQQTQTDVYLYLRSNNVMLGESIHYWGRIDPSPGVVTVKIHYSLIDGAWSGDEKSTGSDGTFEGSITPLSAGTYKIVAFWDGNSQYSAGSSAWTQGEIRFAVVYREFTVTFDTDPKGLSVIVDNLEYSGSSLPHSFRWVPLSTHQIEAKEIIYAGSDIRYVFKWWTSSSALFQRFEQRFAFVRVDRDENIVAHYDTEYRVRLRSDYPGPGFAYPYIAYPGEEVIRGDFLSFREIWVRNGVTISLGIGYEAQTFDQHNNTRRVFSGWTIGSETDSDAGALCTVTAPVVIVANWNTEYYVRVAALPSDGMSSELRGEGWYRKGEQATVVVFSTEVWVNPFVSKRFEGWEIDNTIMSRSPSYSFTVTKPVLVYARWAMGPSLLSYAIVAVVLVGVVASYYFRRRVVSSIPPPSP